MNDHNTFCESDPTCRGASEQCVTCEASFNAGFLAGQAAGRKRCAEIARENYGLSEECIAQKIEGDET